MNSIALLVKDTLGSTRTKKTASLPFTVCTLHWMPWACKNMWSKAPDLCREPRLCIIRTACLELTRWPALQMGISTAQNMRRGRWMLHKKQSHGAASSPMVSSTVCNGTGRLHERPWFSLSSTTGTDGIMIAPPARPPLALSPASAAGAAPKGRRAAERLRGVVFGVVVCGWRSFWLAFMALEST